MIKRPMKGPQVEDLTIVRFPCWAFPKIDGFRCILGTEPLTSRLSPFPNRHFMKKASGLLDCGALLDGEIVCGEKRGKGVLGRTSSGLTSQDGKPDWHLWVFDAPSTAAFDNRYKDARNIVDDLDHKRIHLLKGQWVIDLAELEEFIEECLAKGYEGVITRDPDGDYKEGKSTLRQQGMLKIKPFEDAEGRVKGYFEEEQNTNEAKREKTGKLKRSSARAGKIGKGRLGGLILEDIKSGVEVRVGGGFTQQERIELWKIRDTLTDKLVKYKKQSVGEKDKPRHPGFREFIGWRPEWDVAE